MVEVFNVYKGLQKPLVFKMFKGKFIYWGLGSIVIGLLLCMAISSTVNLFIGIAALVVITGGGLVLTALNQRKGLSSKSKFIGICILQTLFQKNDQN